ncbi:cobalamin B12-binding domain-containing protein [Sandaracinus amylolyticus]|uniref:cobalamin B12-binding domain-containing protein n=1 Tax=Sandaracinus amylolyticus TaxID=927083 RepID=UPI001EED7569|nr:cobalamin-dependent protein [Sandaracinus amylolyticus]UJR80290.1 Methanogenic corrinoid protein MtbC1 [Sandaracinus amylolyticus]
MRRAPAAPDLAELRHAFLDAQLAGDARAGVEVIERGLSGGYDATILRRDLVRDGQETIGRLWQENRISVAREHMGTSVALVALAHLYWRAPLAPPRHRRVLVSCVPGEQHAFPARLAADTLELAGYDVKFLGADVPRESLAGMVHDMKPDLVVLSVTLAFHLPELERTVARIRELVPEVPIAVGGGACGDWMPIAAKLGVSGAGRSAEELLAMIEETFR